MCGGGGGDGSGGGSSSWVNVPLSDTSDYDVSCEYRYHIDYTANDLNRLWTNDVRGIVYVQNVGSRYLGVQVVTAA